MPHTLCIDPWKELLEVLEFGTVWDGQPAEQVLGIAEDERIGLLLEKPGGERIIGLAVREPFAVDPLAIASIWDEPRFVVPALGPEELSAGELLLLVHARYDANEATNDALHLHAAIAAQDDNPELALSMFKLTIEAGDMKGHYGAGYVLLNQGLARPAAEHLGIYTRLTPHNAWAWCWLGRAQAELGEVAAARASYERALEVEATSGFETDAAELLERLG